MKAFPRGDGRHSSIADDKGMDLRDYFAAKAMTNLQHFFQPKDVAIEAYKIADAMMEARENK